MTSYPLATLVATIDATGIHAPSYADILASLKASYQSIFGSDAYLEADSQDGQWIAVLARGFSDLNAALIAAYNARSPSTAQGESLSSVVKINNIRRNAATSSTVDVTLTGEAGRVIFNGVVSDEAQSHKWSLPSTVIIGISGSITVTATCQDKGAVTAAPNTITRIATPTLGWLSVTNASAAAVGAPVEEDPDLRIRREQSTAQAALTPLQAVTAAVSAVPGVTRIQPYENDTDLVDANGLAPHSIALVVEGGDATAIAQQIRTKKGAGAGTFGTSTQIVTDQEGVIYLIRFSRPTLIATKAQIQLKALAGYTSVIGDAVAAAVATYVNGLDIGQDVVLTRLYLPANLFGASDSAKFEILSGGITIAKTADSLASSDIAIAYNERATLAASDVTITVS